MVISISLIAVVWVLWYSLAGCCPLRIIQEHWPVSLTMIFGSFIAGATSEGGGAVAFPVFTKLLNVNAYDAKVFSLAIQSIGMTAASICIIALRVPVEWRVIRWATLGGIPGIFLGSCILASYLSSAQIKIAFTMIVSSFAITLFILNRQSHSVRFYNQQLPKVGGPEKVILLITGCIGGLMSGLVGNGIDIICFSLMVLLFQISEKVATPTSVVLMAINAIVGFSLHVFFLRDFTDMAYNYWLAAIPVVVIGAPLGAWFCSRLHSKTIAQVLMGLISIEFISSLYIIPLTLDIIVIATVTLLFFSALYCTLYYYSKLYRSCS